MSKKIIILLSSIALLGSLIWVITDLSWESTLAFLGLLVTLISLLSKEKNSKGKTPHTSFIQKGGKESNNYQSGRDININTKDDKR